MTKADSEDAQSGNYNHHYTFSAASSARRPSLFQTDTIVKMHSAVELNKRLIDKSKDAALVLMNIPAPPKTAGIADYNCRNIILYFPIFKSIILMIYFFC